MNAHAAGAADLPGRRPLADLFALAKPRIVALVLVTIAVGFVLAPGPGEPVRFTWLMLGAMLVAAGSNALNQVAERDADARMHRTRRRPVAAGRLSPRAGAVFAWVTAAAGVAGLAVLVNPLTAGIAAATFLSYVFAYTPLKRQSALATLVGAVPGALPILGGWTGAGGALDWTAWTLFAILFLWQLPHFLALAWLYRDDYDRAGMRMLSGGDTEGKVTFRQAVLYALALLPVSLAPVLRAVTGTLYFAGALVLGAWLVWRSAGAARSPTAVNARKLFVASIVYLPVLLALMVIARI